MREQGMVNFPGLNNAPARTQLPGMLGEPLGPTETRTVGSGRTSCSLLGLAGSCPTVPQGAENSVKWTQEPAQSPCRGLRSQQPALDNSRHQTRPCLVLRKQGGLRPSPVCRGAPRDGRSRNRGAALLEWSDGVPLHTGAKEPL